jgi:peptidoglycan/LPS O-acetylase OafA/YrhL
MLIAVNANRLTGLDALRGVAAICVLGFHCGTVFGVWPVFSRSYLAVDFFFMLSGFVMARTYEHRFPELTPANFIIVRLRRLWPIMAAGTLLGAVFFALIGASWQLLLLAVSAGLLFVPALNIGQPYLLNRAEWSIFFELFANAVHALLLWRLKTSQLLVVVALCVLATYAHAQFLGLKWLLAGSTTPIFAGGFARVLISYCLGIVFHREGWRIRLPFSGAVVLLPGAMLCLALAPFSVVLDLAFVLVVAPAVLAIGIEGRASAVGRLLGAMSFPLYAVHYPVLRLAHHFDGGPVAGAAAALLVAGVLAVPALRHGVKAAAAPAVGMQAGNVGG